MKEFLPVYGFSFLILTVAGLISDVLTGLEYNYALYGIIAGVIIPPITAICMIRRV